MEGGFEVHLVGLRGGSPLGRLMAERLRGGNRRGNSGRWGRVEERGKWETGKRERLRERGTRTMGEEGPTEHADDTEGLGAAVVAGWVATRAIRNFLAGSGGGEGLGMTKDQ